MLSIMRADAKIFVSELSRTCWHVEGALIEYPDLFKAASISDGVDFSYMQSMMFDPGQRGQLQTMYKVPPYGAGLDVWLQLAPSFHLDKVKTPVILTAIGPTSVLSEWEIYSSLFQQKKPVDFMYIPDGQHILQKPLERLASQQGTVDWFRFWLQHYERPNPEDPDQYKRWEHLQEFREGDLKSTAK
jgi:hypothetical protein